MEQPNNKPYTETQNPASPDTESLETQAAAKGGPPGPPPPHKEQRRYWKQDLFYKKTGLFISSGGFFLVIVGLVINIIQSEKVAKSIRANVESSTVTQVTKLDQVFMQKPDLIPYFYEGKSIDDKATDYREVSATAVMVLDVFDLVASQNRHFPEFWDTPGAWDEWMIDVFSTSPILRATIDKYPNWYGPDLKELRRKGQERLEKKAAQSANPQDN
jgi:hypothetical protein